VPIVHKTLSKPTAIGGMWAKGCLGRCGWDKVVANG
jgi:hypothetical protein